MKKLVVVLALAFIVISGGCISGNQSQTSPQTSTAKDGTLTSESSVPLTSQSSGEKISINPLKILESIKQYTYLEKARINLEINMTTGNITQQTNVSLLIEENGYINIEEKKAKIRTKTTTLPGNMTFNTTWIIIDNRVYVENFGNVTFQNNTEFWEIHPIAIARELLKLKPIGNYTENGTLVLVYSVPEKLILPLVELYFTTPKMNTTVTDAVAELYFTKDGFKGMKLIYNIRATAITQGIGGETYVREIGTWKGTIKIITVNKKEEVKAPST